MTKRTEMSQPVYGNINNGGTWKMDRRTKRYQTGSDCVNKRNDRAATVCLGLLCVLLLTAVIVLSVYIYTNSTNYTQERNELQTNNASLAEERDELLINIANIAEERDQLLTRITNLTNERHELMMKRDLIKQFVIFGKENGWTYYQSSFYYMSNVKKSWNESRIDCMNRRADLVIINNKEEQDFVMKITRNEEFWIGLTDSEEEGRWKWVDGTKMTSGFWASSGSITEPNGNTWENCVVTHLKKHPELEGWLDVSCNNVYQWICEKMFHDF